jgi:hypothetical protein
MFEIIYFYFFMLEINFFRSVRFFRMIVNKKTVLLKIVNYTGCFSHFTKFKTLIKFFFEIALTWSIAHFKEQLNRSL